MSRQQVWKLVGLTLLMVASSISVLAQGTFVYTNNDQSPNSVSAFLVGANGALTKVPGSPFATGGTGRIGFFANNRITTAIVKDFLYVGNSGSNNVSAFSINPVTGVLTLVPGSPFATGGTADTVGISLATTPDDKFLIAANGGSLFTTIVNTITVYSIAANGVLSQVAGSPFPVGAGKELVGIKVTPDGKFLAVARYDTNAVSMFSISATGTLTPVPSSPFPAGVPSPPVFGGSFASGIDCNCSSNHLFIGEANGTSVLTGSDIVSVQNIALNGALSPIAGSPFTGPGANSNVVVLSPDDNYLFVSNQYSDTVTAFSVDPCTGALTLVPGSPFHLPSLGQGIHVPSFPSGMATDPAGKFLYVADFYSNKIIGFSIAANGALTSSVPGSPFSNGFPVTGPFPSPPGLVSLAVFPPKTCKLVPFVLSVPKLEITAGPPPGFQLNGSFTLGKNSNGINPVTETVTLQIGTFSVTIPPCSFQNTHGTFAFQGTINGVSLQVQIVPLANNNFTFKAQGSGVDLTGLTNPVTVVLTIGINSGTTTTTAQFQ